MRKLWKLLRSKSNEYRLHKIILKILYMIRLIYIVMILCIGISIYTDNYIILIGLIPLYICLKEYKNKFEYYNKQAIKHCMDVMVPVFDEMMIHARNEKDKKL